MAWITFSWLFWYPYNRAIGWSHKDLTDLLGICRKIG